MLELRHSVFEAHFSVCDLNFLHRCKRSYNTQTCKQTFFMCGWMFIRLAPDLSWVEFVLMVLLCVYEQICCAASSVLSFYLLVLAFMLCWLNFSTINRVARSIKEIVQPKRKILSFTWSHVIPYISFFWVESKRKGRMFMLLIFIQ